MLAARIVAKAQSSVAFSVGLIGRISFRMLSGLLIPLRGGGRHYLRAGAGAFPPVFLNSSKTFPTRVSSTAGAKRVGKL